MRKSDDVRIRSVHRERVATQPGVAPALPPTVVATNSDGSRDSRIPVMWQPIDPERYAEPGRFHVRGDVEGTWISARAKVTVRG